MDTKFNAPRRAPRSSETKGKGDLPVADAGWATCPECDRTWLVTAADDVWVPACGCYGIDWSEAERWRPCRRCGLKHEETCTMDHADEDILVAGWDY